MSNVNNSTQKEMYQLQFIFIYERTKKEKNYTGYSKIQFAEITSVTVEISVFHQFWNN